MKPDTSEPIFIFNKKNVFEDEDVIKDEVVIEDKDVIKDEVVIEDEVIIKDDKTQYINTHQNSYCGCCCLNGGYTTNTVYYDGGWMDFLFWYWYFSRNDNSFPNYNNCCDSNCISECCSNCNCGDSCCNNCNDCNNCDDYIAECGQSFCDCFLGIDCYIAD